MVYHFDITCIQKRKKNTYTMYIPSQKKTWLNFLVAPDRPADLARLTGCSSWWDLAVCRNGGSGKGKLSYWESILTIFQKLVHQNFWNCWLDCWKSSPEVTKATPLVRHLFARLLAACSIDASVQMSIETITEPEGCPFWWVDPFLKKKQVSNFASQFVYLQNMKLFITFQQLIQIRKVHPTFSYPVFRIHSTQWHYLRPKPSWGCNRYGSTWRLWLMWLAVSQMNAP